MHVNEEVRFTHLVEQHERFDKQEISDKHDIARTQYRTKTRRHEDSRQERCLRQARDS